MDLNLSQAETVAVQALLLVTTTSAAVRFICIVFMDDLWEIIRRYREHKLKREREEL